MKHVISIESPQNGDVFQNSLILCLGHIKHVATDCITCTHLYFSSSLQQTPQKLAIHTKTNRFKTLIELKCGFNDISFNYCCISITVNVEFQEGTSNLHILPLYVICEGHKGNFQAPDSENNSIESACTRITLGCKLLQTVFASKLKGRTFLLDPSGCLVFHSKLQVEQVYKMNQLELWQSLAREIMSSGIGCVSKKYIGFLSCTKYNGKPRKNASHAELISLTDGYVAFGGEAFALLGTACLYTWPENLSQVEGCFNDETLIDSMRLLDDSCFRGTLGGCFATSLGAAIHELCHTFDLGHNERGIMGRGFNNIQQFFLNDDTGGTGPTDAFWNKNELTLLYYHRWFNDYARHGKKVLHYDPVSKIVKSTAGIRVVELRQGSNQMVIAYWVFTDKVLKYSYQINYEVNNDCDTTVVVGDNSGNILKQLFV